MTRTSKQLSQREAWLLMAEHWRADRISKTGSPVDGSCESLGLCRCLVRICVSKLITEETYSLMRERLALVRRPHDGYSWPTTQRGAQARRRFCLRMARELAVTQATERMGSDGTVSEDSK